MDQFLPFKDPVDCNGYQITVLTAIYGGILFTSANMIGDGSELLLLVPSLAGLVGSVVLPVLGAVPDGMMVLFSGIGPRMQAQEQLAVGVGALAGSTIMLLTIPWFLAIYGGRVSIKNGKCTYNYSPKLDKADAGSFTRTGVCVGPKIAKNGLVMLITACFYLVVQAPVFFNMFQAGSVRDTTPALAVLQDKAIGETDKEYHAALKMFDHEAAKVNFFSMVGAVVCSFGFLGYLWLQTDDGKDEDKQNEVANVRVDAIREGKITLRGVMHGLSAGTAGDETLLDVTSKEIVEMKQILRPFFHFYDANRDLTLSKYEFGKIMVDLKEGMSQEAEMALFDSADTDGSGEIDFEEFVALMARYVKGGVTIFDQSSGQQTVIGGAVPSSGRSGQKLVSTGGNASSNGQIPLSARGAAKDAETGKPGAEEEEDEEEEMPEDLRDLSPEEQQRTIKTRAAWMMGFGTLLVLVFSDPAVDVLSNIGVRLNVNAFYISFVLAPLASNASELVAAYNYGCKKTQAMMTISLSTLEGAACMNNTFCLAIFFALIWQQNLVWTYSAETLSIILIQVVVGYYALTRRVHTTLDAAIVFCMYPLSIFFVYALQNIVGMA